MGSGSSRKVSDRPIIRTPKGSGGGEGGGSQQVADVCIPSFQVALSGEYVTGMKLTLDTAKELCEVWLAGKRIAALDRTLSQMVQRCEEFGVTYGGEIITDKNGECYARFHRSDS